MTLPESCILCGETEHRGSQNGRTATRYFDCGLEYNPKTKTWHFFPMNAEGRESVAIIHLAYLIKKLGGVFPHVKQVGFVR